MTLKEFIHYILTGSLLLIVLGFISFGGYLVANMWPLLFNIIAIAIALFAAALVLGIAYDIWFDK